MLGSCLNRVRLPRAVPRRVHRRNCAGRPSQAFESSPGGGGRPRSGVEPERRGPSIGRRLLQERATGRRMSTTSSEGVGFETHRSIRHVPLGDDERARLFPRHRCTQPRRKSPRWPGILRRWFPAISGRIRGIIGGECFFGSSGGSVRRRKSKCSHILTATRPGRTWSRGSPGSSA